MELTHQVPTLSEIVKFVTQFSREGEPWSVDEEYPLVFQPNNQHNLKTRTVNGQLVGHAAFKPLIVRTPEIVWKVGLIGSVVVHPQFRGRGLARDLIEECCHEAIRQDCDFVILWSQLHEFYERLGFTLAGFEEHYTFDRRLKPLSLLGEESSQWIFRDTLRVDPEVILKVYQKHSVVSHRSSHDIKKFLSIPKTELFTLWSSSGELKAYSVMGKGADFPDYVHEWGGGCTELIELWNRILTHRDGKAFSIVVGSQSANLRLKLQSLGVPSFSGYLGLFRVLQISKLEKKLNSYLKDRGLEPSLGIKELESGRLYLSWRGESREFSRSSELVTFVFGSPAVSLPMENEGGRLGSLFPVHFWIWGWDSI